MCVCAVWPGTFAGLVYHVNVYISILRDQLMRSRHGEWFKSVSRNVQIKVEEARKKRVAFVLCHAKIYLYLFEWEMVFVDGFWNWLYNFRGCQFKEIKFEARKETANRQFLRFKFKKYNGRVCFFLEWRVPTASIWNYWLILITSLVFGTMRHSLLYPPNIIKWICSIQKYIVLIGYANIYHQNAIISLTEHRWK